jgi:hypothetical protein
LTGFAEAFAEAATLADADVDADRVVELNRILDRGMSYVHLLGFNGDIPVAFQRRWTNVCRMETEAKSIRSPRKFLNFILDFNFIRWHGNRRHSRVQFSTPSLPRT